MRKEEVVVVYVNVKNPGVVAKIVSKREFNPLEQLLFASGVDEVQLEHVKFIRTKSRGLYHVGGPDPGSYMPRDLIDLARGDTAELAFTYEPEYCLPNRE